MTDVLKYIDVNPDEAKRMAQRMHVKKDEIRLIRKGFAVKIEDQNDDERTITARVSTADRDRDDEVISPKGIDLKDYQKNPVLLWGHQYGVPAIGKCLWSKTDSNGLICKFQFAETQFADDIYQLYKGGFMKAFSIGFIPMEYDQKTKTHEKISLLEVSAVSVPANQNALVMEAYQKGIIKSESLRKEVEAQMAERMNMKQAAEAEAIEIDDEPEMKSEAAPVNDPAPVNSAETKAETDGDEPEAKAFDTEKNPGIWDILNAVWRLFSKSSSEARPGSGFEPEIMLEDLFPVNYPSGHLVYSQPDDEGEIQTFMVDYTYSKGVVTLGENPVPVVIAWKRGSKRLVAQDAKSAGEITVKLRMDTEEFDAQMKAVKDRLEELRDVKNAALGHPKGSPGQDPALIEDVLESIDAAPAHPAPEQKAQDMTPEEVQKAIVQAIEKIDLSNIINNAVSLNLDRLRGRVR